MLNRSRFPVIILGMLFVGMLFMSCFSSSAVYAEEFYYIPPPPVPGGAGDRPVWTAQDLLRPEILSNAQFGMSMVSIEDGPIAKVVTTGGEFIFNKATDTIECKQRIAKKRSVAVIKLTKGTLAGIKLTHKSSGAAIFGGNGSTVRINCDSLLMLQPARDGDIKAELSFIPDYHSEYVGNYNFYDPYGGISFFEHGKCPNSDFYAATDPVTVTWPWKKGNVFWASVSPPRSFDWDTGNKFRIVWFGSSADRYMYPSDLTLKRLKDYLGTTNLHLHNELMWDMSTRIEGRQKWDKPLRPYDEKEYLRVIRTCKELGITVDPYASPYYTGGGEELYFKQASRLVKDYETKALYFDEIYRGLPWLATAYHFTRTARQLVGDDGTLIFHCTEDVLVDRREREGEMSGRTACPVIHTYYNVLYRGEAEWNKWGDDFIRYRLSAYNISNAIGTIVFDDRCLLTPEKIDYWLSKGNLRLWLGGSDIYDGRIKLFQEYYFPRLNSSLKKEIEPDLLKPTGAFQRFRDSIKHELAQK